MLLTLDSNLSEYEKQREAQREEIARIEAIPSRPRRWRAIQKLMFNINPSLIREDQIHCAAVAELRDSAKNQFAAGKAMRQLYSMPEYLYRAFQTLDPEFQKIQSSRDAQLVRNMNRAIWREFNEYRVARSC